MSRPKLLDLFCGAGGAAMGYHRAGFDVTGIDCKPMKRYPFTFICGDALDYLAEHGHEYDAIHASPPCQAYSARKHMSTKEHPQLVETVRELLIASGKPYVIENVPGAPLCNPFMLCGSMFGLQTTCGAQLRRHRLFETPLLLMSPGPCCHKGITLSVHGDHPRNEGARWENRRCINVVGKVSDTHRTISVTGTGNALGGVISIHGGHARDRRRTISITGSTPQQNVVRNVVRECFSIKEAKIAMGIDWMVMKELSQAIPPAYTEWIGRQLIEAI